MNAGTMPPVSAGGMQPQAAAPARGTAAKPDESAFHTLLAALLGGTPSDLLPARPGGETKDDGPEPDGEADETAAGAASVLAGAAVAGHPAGTVPELLDGSLDDGPGLPVPASAEAADLPAGGGARAGRGAGAPPAWTAAGPAQTVNTPGGAGGLPAATGPEEAVSPAGRADGRTGRGTGSVVNPAAPAGAGARGRGLASAAEAAEEPGPAAEQEAAAPLRPVRAEVLRAQWLDGGAGTSADEAGAQPAQASAAAGDATGDGAETSSGRLAGQEAALPATGDRPAAPAGEDGLIPPGPAAPDAAPGKPAALVGDDSDAPAAQRPRAVAPGPGEPPGARGPSDAARRDAPAPSGASGSGAGSGAAPRPAAAPGAGGAGDAGAKAWSSAFEPAASLQPEEAGADEAGAPGGSGDGEPAPPGGPDGRQALAAGEELPQVRSGRDATGADEAGDARPSAGAEPSAEPAARRDAGGGPAGARSEAAARIEPAGGGTGTGTTSGGPAGDGAEGFAPGESGSGGAAGYAAGAAGLSGTSARSAEAPPGPALAESVASQLRGPMEDIVAELIRTPAEGGRPEQVTIRLRPEFLGQVVMRIAVDADGVVTARFVAEHALVRSLIEQHLPELRETLAQHGLELGEAAVSGGEAGLAWDGSPAPGEAVRPATRPGQPGPEQSAEDTADSGAVSPVPGEYLIDIRV